MIEVIIALALFFTPCILVIVGLLMLALVFNKKKVEVGVENINQPVFRTFEDRLREAGARVMEMNPVTSIDKIEFYGDFTIEKYLALGNKSVYRLQHADLGGDLGVEFNNIEIGKTIANLFREEYATELEAIEKRTKKSRQANETINIRLIK